jgi:hypothetical protein
VIAAALALCLAGADARGSAVLLPLLPEGTVTTTQASGISARLRESAAAFSKVLSSSKDDQRQADECKRDARCLGRLAVVRGADVVVAGVLAPAADGLRVSLVVAGPNAVEALRRVETTLRGDERDARRIDRLVRSAIDPAALRGSLRVLGEEGATVSVDGVAAGTLPLAAPIAELSEGDHVVVVSKLGWRDEQRTVHIVHDEVTELKVVLLAPGDPASPSVATASTGPSAPLIVGAVGGGLFALGVVAGALSLRDALDVEARAQKQQLLLPRDSGLLLRGHILAWTANGLYAAAAVTLAAAGALVLVGGEEP